MISMKVRALLAVIAVLGAVVGGAAWTNHASAAAWTNHANTAAWTD
jgi:hypothetical protein